MPPADRRTGDTRRDPRALIAAALLLLLLRAGVTVWEDRNLPASDAALPGAPAPMQFHYSHSSGPRTP
jgi:hypothetical protein